VAVVQISKIQVRRGKKNSNTGVPQLSSAEFAWAVDTQELFIGNGSVAEGSPEVGNTKVLTENDNLIQLANAYEFAADNFSITNTQSRSLQSKIDEIQVSVQDFGADPDGSTDNTAAFENAFAALFQNPDDSYKKVLYVPNGEYLFTNDLQIPSDVILRGETKLNSILNIAGNTVTFLTADGKNISEFDSSNRPVNIVIENLTVRRSEGTVNISGVANATIKDVRFVGEYQLGQTVSSVSEETAALTWTNDIIGTRVTDLKIYGCEFVNNSVSARVFQNAVFDTSVTFVNCQFKENYTSVYLTGQTGQGNYWTFDSCAFEEIFENCLWLSAGKGTKILDSDFVNCGNGLNGAGTPSVPMIVFGENEDNVVFNCTSDRQENAGLTNSTNTSYVVEVLNASAVNFTNKLKKDIFLTDAFNAFAVIGSANSYSHIDYVLTLGSETRSGRLTVSVDTAESKVGISDSYDFCAGSLTSAAGLLMTNFEFSATLRDNDSVSGNDTVVLEYKNPIATGETGTISFSVGYGV